MEKEESTLTTTTTNNNSAPLTQHSNPSSCHCEVYEKLMKESLVIKEATTGYLDPITGQESGNFVTYVIELGVHCRVRELFF